MTMPESDLQVTITLRDIYLQQQDMVKTIAKIEPAISQFADHESRIRVLEGFKYTVFGVVLFLTFTINVIAVIVEAKLFHGH
jgi:hypothetical protein